MSEEIKNLADAYVQAQAGGNKQQEAILANNLLAKKFTGRNTHRTVNERFFERLCFGASDCWYWAGALNKSHYGIFRGCGEELAHRVSWALHNGPIPAGYQVLHTCDVPSCVNPQHLKIGTQADNMRDMQSKGRRKGIAAGDKNGRVRIFDEELSVVRTLYAEGQTLAQIAKRFKVGISTISRIIRGERK